MFLTAQVVMRRNIFLKILCMCICLYFMYVVKSILPVPDMTYNVFSVR